METVSEERSGLSRRALIKRAAAAGAVAWTAPVIVDSVLTPAGALSPPCNKRWVKLTPSGSCYAECPGNLTTFPVSDAYWVGAPSPYGGCSGGNGCASDAGDAPQQAISVASGTYYKVTLANCVFSASAGWTIGGRYEPGEPGGHYEIVTTTCVQANPTTNPPASGNGCYIEGGNVAWVIADWGGSGDSDLNYIYLKFCC